MQAYDDSQANLAVTLQAQQQVLESRHYTVQRANFDVMTPTTPNPPDHAHYYGFSLQLGREHDSTAEYEKRLTAFTINKAKVRFSAPGQISSDQLSPKEDLTRDLVLRHMHALCCCTTRKMKAR